VLSGQIFSASVGREVERNVELEAYKTEQRARVIICCRVEKLSNVSSTE
jgi:hypothetical protein